MKYLILFFAILFSFSRTNAQSKKNELASFSELHFFSDAEKEFYTNIVEKKTDYFHTLACVDPSIGIGDANSYYNRFELLLKKYDDPKWSGKKPPKKIKTLYNDIHETFFDQYEEKNMFSDIFKAGKYNCVSATGMYAVALSELRIPYVIKEEPTHVYIVAFPETDQIVVEATNPSAGYRQYSTVFKKDFVDRLTKVKLIGSEEAASKTTEELFEKYFFTKKNIELQELVAIQYYNDALYKMEDGDFKTAFLQLEKSYYLYPSERIGYLTYINATALLDKLSYQDEDYVPTILKLARYEKFGVSNEMIIGEYSNIINHLLFEKSDVTKNDTLYSEFYSAIEDSTYHNEIDYVYFYETGRFYYTQGNYEKALKYVAGAYKVKPDNVQVQTFLIAALGNKLNGIQDIERANIVVNAYFDSYPKLIENSNFKRMVVTAKLELASYYFYKKIPSKAKACLNEFEEIDLGHLKPDESAISKVYSSAALYYYQKGAVSTARSYLNKGLTYYPNDFNLNRMLKMMH